MDSSHYYRQWWFWGGEANLRVNGAKIELITIPDEAWLTVELSALQSCGEIAAESEVTAKLVEIFK